MKYKFAVFGDPISHSLSPEIHLQFGKDVGLHIDYRKETVSAEDFNVAVSNFFSKGGHGLNITVPHKERAYKIAVKASPEAEFARAANTLIQTKEGILAHNTDGFGLLADFKRLNFGLKDKNILILGAGGAISGCLAPICNAKPKTIYIANRTLAKAKNLADRADGNIISMSLEELQDWTESFDLIINGTSAGLQKSFSFNLNQNWFCPTTVYYDLSYGVEETKFLSLCSPYTAFRHDGLGMLLGQAAFAFALWTKIEPNPFKQLSKFGRE